MKTARLTLLGLIIGTGGALVASCSNIVDDCDKMARCPPPAAGASQGGQSTGGKTQAGGRTSSGGNASGGVAGLSAAGSGTAGTSSVSTAGTAGQAPCNGTCAAPTPYCRTDTNVCVACTESTHCTGTTPVCDTAKNVCVGCTTKEHCTAPKGVCTSDSVCVECVTSADCTYSVTKTACKTDSKTCVECTSNSDCKGVPGKPACDTTTNLCVGCLNSAHCTDPAKPQCDTAAKSCVACLSNADCKTAAASKCDTTTGSPTANTCLPCTADIDCSQVAGKTVCLPGTTPQANQCVQCTGKKYSACGQSSGKALVCDSEAHTCSTDKTAQSVGLCAPCISDAQCLAGQLCAPQTFQGQAVGNFCFWKQGDTANGAPTDCTTATNRPYVNIQSNAVSIDSETATLCTLRAVTTCTALNQYSTTNCASSSNTPDDNICGFAHGVDSKCVAFGANQFRCTTVCGSVDDCKPGFTCNTGITPNVCSL